MDAKQLIEKITELTEKHGNKDIRISARHIYREPIGKVVDGGEDFVIIIHD